jgi:energy-coupling factor transporter ATP-binding protein EcfA2
MSKGAIKDIGPIAHLDFPVPEDGGIVVFKGANGSGKSTALETIDAAVAGRGRPAARDGTLKGEFQGFGVKLTVGRSTRRSGEAEVHSLEGKFDVSTLVEPGIADAEKADAHRIKALVQLTGCKPDPNLFRPLVADVGDFDSLVSPSTLTHSDLLQMAAAVKRDFDAAARKAEHEETNARSRAEACRKATEGVDLDAECRGEVLQQELEEAIAARAKMEADDAAAGRAISAADQARKALDRAKAEYTGPTPEEAQQELDAADGDVATAQGAVEAAERVLAEARERQRAAVSTRDRRQQRKAAAEQHARLASQWQEQIDAAADVRRIPAEQLTEAAQAAGRARERLVQGGIIIRAKAQLTEADDYRKLAERHRERAERLRAAGQGVDGVLSDLVAKSGVPLRVEIVDHRMRLVLDTKRGRTCFGELSDGERWRIAIDIAIQAVGTGGEITLPQASWEGLDNENRRAIARQAREGRIIIYTAECDDGDLRADVYQEAADAVH